MTRAERAGDLQWTDALLEQLSELDHLYQTAPVGLSLLDRELRYRRINKRLAELNGRPVSMHIGRSLREVLPQLAPTLEPILHRVIETARPVLNVELHTDDPARDLLVNYYPLMTAEGQVRAISGVVQDVTEIKQAEAALREAHDLLEQRVRERTRELSDANVRLREEIAERQKVATALEKSEKRFRRHRDELAHVARVATLGELAAALAHELNQPLSAILSNAQAALRFLDCEAPDLGELRGALCDIVDDDKRAGEVIRRLRALLRKGVHDHQLLDVNHLIREIVSLARLDALEKKISLRLELDDDLPPVFGDRIQLQQVSLNLLLNATEAMSSQIADPREVLVRTSRADSDTIEVTVRDSGVGIADEILERIFDAFFTTRAEGLGMGLSISRTIIEAHGGRLWATSNPERGATFHFTLPMARG